jgi:hypothetical protein
MLHVQIWRSSRMRRAVLHNVAGFAVLDITRWRRLLARTALV